MTLRKLLFQMVLVISLGLFMAGCCTTRTSQSFTPWMDQVEFAELLEEYETKVDGKNFWSKGHWVNAVEGRWEAGRPQYRIIVGDTPRDRKYWWYWWFNQSQADFNNHIHKLADDGFTLVQSSSFTWPDGSTRYNGVWHKTK